MKILSIETSCDETGISIIEMFGSFSARGGSAFGGKILANILNSQIKIHAPYGGVFPALAKREHQKNLPILLAKALKKTKLKEKEIDLITVTSGPGLEPALWTGIVFAKELAKNWKVPLVPVNHMEGHIFSVFVKKGNTFTIPQIKFPSLALLVSGGHTELVLIKNFRNYEIIGETLDDAAGEAFDKVARMLELPYPGGPQISALAEFARKNAGYTQKNTDKGRQHQSASSLRKSALSQQKSAREFNFIKFPRPMLHSKNFNFSFSGLKTAVLYLIRDLKEKDLNILQNDKTPTSKGVGVPTLSVGIKQMIAKEFEDAVVETLVHKTKKAIEKYKVKNLIVAGGVSANKFLQKEIKKIKTKVFFPNKKLTGDNALMIGIAGYFKFKESKGKIIKADKIKAEGGLKL